MTRNKVLRTILPILITLAIGGGLYYYAPPALNIHDSRLWWTVIFLLVIVTVLGMNLYQTRSRGNGMEKGAKG